MYVCVCALEKRHRLFTTTININVGLNAWSLIVSYISTRTDILIGHIDCSCIYMSRSFLVMVMVVHPHSLQSGGCGGGVMFLFALCVCVYLIESWFAEREATKQLIYMNTWTEDINCDLLLLLLAEQTDSTRGTTRQTRVRRVWPVVSGCMLQSSWSTPRNQEENILKLNHHHHHQYIQWWTGTRTHHHQTLINRSELVRNWPGMMSSSMCACVYVSVCMFCVILECYIISFDSYWH